MINIATSWGPEKTPRVIRYLILLTVLLTLFAALTDRLFIYFFGAPGPQELLSLSWLGLLNYYYWQPITYFFIQKGMEGIDLSFLISLTFNMYILWVFGTMVYERTGAVRFLGLYLITGILTGICTLLMMPIIGSYAVLAGSSAVLLSVFTVWAMYYPENDLLLFFLFPVTPRWLLGGVIATICLVTFSELDVISFFFYAFALLWGYLYGLLLLNLKSPYQFTWSFDQAVLRLKQQLLRLDSHESKIIDITTRETWNDDETFMDEMLTKISKYGETALTHRERQRMQQISERKMKEKEGE